MGLGDVIQKILEEKYALDTNEFTIFHVNKTSLFEFLIGVILSQNTSDKNAVKAYKTLRENLGEITPQRIIEAGVDNISELIKPAGMFKKRSRVIFELAKVFSIENFEENLAELVKNNDPRTARKILLELPGVGDKTADVVLLMFFGKPVFPVDTHIKRITRRLGYAGNTKYEELSNFWASNTSPSNYVKLHLLLITHGRKTCKAIKPRCPDCPLINYCHFGQRVVSYGTR